MAKGKGKSETQGKVTKLKAVGADSASRKNVSKKVQQNEKKTTNVTSLVPLLMSGASIAEEKIVKLNRMENIMSKTAAAFDTKAFDKMAKETADFGRECSEACAKANAILVKGMEEIMGAVASIAQSSAEKQAKFAKEAMSSKTINEFAEIQNKIAQTSFDDFMSSFTKLSEMSVKVLTEGAEPMNAQIVKAIQRATDTMAA